MGRCDSDNATVLVDPTLNEMAHQYWRIHPYLSITVCTFGIVTNIFNIITLTRKHMRTPINCILTGIAVTDILTMVSYIPFAIHFYIETDLTPTPERYSFGWSYFMLCHQNLTTTTHTASIWLAVFLAMLRYRCLQGAGSKGRNALTFQSTAGFVALIYILSALLLVPNYVIMKIEPVQMGNFTLWRFVDGGVYSTEKKALAITVFWAYALLGKLIPCFLISIFGGLLLNTLYLSKKRTENLKAGAFQQRLRQHSRTTKMLLAVIVMFLITELPQSILLVLSGTIDCFFANVYLLLADTMDILALLNNAINFVLYCAMSQQFRDTFVKLLFPMSARSPRPTQSMAEETVALKAS